MSASKVLVWDLPTRVFHWLLVIGLATTLALAEFAGEGGTGFQAHMIMGMVLGLMLVLRVGWGIVGSRYARFDALAFSPAAVLRYLRSAVTGSDHQWVGHNPGSAYAIIAMLTLLGTTVVTGLMMSAGGEAAEELHEVASSTLMAVIAVHIIGVVWYSVRHRENITLGMITGRKEGQDTDAIVSSRPVSALIFLAIVGYATFSLFQNFDPTKGHTRLPLVDTMISLEGSEEHDD